MNEDKDNVEYEKFWLMYGAKIRCRIIKGVVWTEALRISNYPAEVVSLIIELGSRRGIDVKYDTAIVKVDEKTGRAGVRFLWESGENSQEYKPAVKKLLNTLFVNKNRSLFGEDVSLDKPLERIVDELANEALSSCGRKTTPPIMTAVFDDDSSIDIDGVYSTIGQGSLPDDEPVNIIGYIEGLSKCQRFVQIVSKPNKVTDVKINVETFYEDLKGRLSDGVLYLVKCNKKYHSKSSFDYYFESFEPIHVSAQGDEDAPTDTVVDVSDFVEMTE